MNNLQNIEIQKIIQYLSTVKPEELENAFAERWKPFIESLEKEEDRVEAFQIFYEWQISQMDLLAKHVEQLPLTIPAA